MKKKECTCYEEGCEQCNPNGNFFSQNPNENAKDNRLYTREEVRLLICKYAKENGLGWTNNTTDNWIKENV